MSLLYGCSEVGNPTSTNCGYLFFSLYKMALKKREKENDEGVGVFCQCVLHVEPRVK
jgi:hypothetical protein